MTFKEKLAKDYPIYVIERLKEGCYGCPSSYGYEPTQPKYFCQNTSCGICWNRIIPGTEGEEKVFTKDDLKDEILSGRFHAYIFTVIFSKPVTQLIQSLCEGRKASLLIFRTIIGISNTDTGIDPCFVDIKPTAVEF